MMCSLFVQPSPFLNKLRSTLMSRKGNGEACIFDFGIKHVFFTACLIRKKRTHKDFVLEKYVS